MAGFCATEHGPSVARPAEPSPIHRLFCSGFAGWAAAADACSVEIAIADVDSAQRQGTKTGCALGRPGHICGLAAIIWQHISASGCSAGARKSGGQMTRLLIIVVIGALPGTLCTATSGLE